MTEWASKIDHWRTILALTLAQKFEEMSKSRPRVYISPVLKDIISSSQRTEPLFQLNPIKSYGLTKLATFGEKRVVAE